MVDAPYGRTSELSTLCADIYHRVEHFLADEANTPAIQEVQAQTRLSLGILADALARYSLDELSLSYNGGKDCLVLLILYLAALHIAQTKESFTIPTKLRSVYIVSPHPFREVEEFVDSSKQTYHLDLTHFAKPMRDAFEDYLLDNSNIKAIFVGTRRTDPFAQTLQHFDPTDHGWPKFVRIHPVLDWHYANVWTFLRCLDIPYCSLYDKGFTSLGSIQDTHPNPVLRLASNTDDDVAKFRPAYELVRDDEERLGRDRRTISSPTRNA